MWRFVHKIKNAIISAVKFKVDTLLYPSYKAPDALDNAEKGFGQRAKPLERSEMERWKWYADWLTKWWRTEEQQRRAECAQQPTMGDCIYATGKDGTTIFRARPRVPTPDSVRALNDYDHLLDMRVLSPNNKAVGFFDWDRNEIARENAFTPPPPSELSTPSPVPGEGSLQAMMWPSLVDHPYRPRSRRRRPSDIPDVPGESSGLSSAELADFVERFRALPFCHHLEVLARSEEMGWMDALAHVEEQQKRSKLPSLMRERYDQVKALHQQAKLLLQRIERESEALSQECHHAIAAEYPLHDFTAIDSVLGISCTTWEEKMWQVQDGQAKAEELRYELFWHAVIQLFDTQGMDLHFRQQAVQKFLQLKRQSNLSCIVSDIGDWFDKVGDHQEELRGIYERGDFWDHVLEEWRRLLTQAETEYCVVDDSEAGEMSLEKLSELDGQHCPVRWRAGEDPNEVDGEAAAQEAGDEAEW